MREMLDSRMLYKVDLVNRRRDKETLEENHRHDDDAPAWRKKYKLYDMWWTATGRTWQKYAMASIT